MAKTQSIVQLDSQRVHDDASHGKIKGIPQLNGFIENVVEVQPEVEEEVTLTFISNYGEEDVLDSLEELIDAKSVPDSIQGIEPSLSVQITCVSW